MNYEVGTKTVGKKKKKVPKGFSQITKLQVSFFQL